VILLNHIFASDELVRWKTFSPKHLNTEFLEETCSATMDETAHRLRYQGKIE